MPSPRPPDYAALAAFRHTLRNFLLFSAEAARAVGLSPQQHQALLAIKGCTVNGTLTIGELAARLHVRSHSAVGLINRLARRGLVHRLPAPDDRRRVRLGLTERGEALLGRLSATHHAELRQVGPELRRLLEELS